MAIHFTFIASFVMPRKISYQHQWEELKNSHLGVSITSNVITSNDITSIVITSNDLFVMCSIARTWTICIGHCFSCCCLTVKLYIFAGFILSWKRQYEKDDIKSHILMIFLPKDGRSIQIVKRINGVRGSLVCNCHTLLIVLIFKFLKIAMIKPDKFDNLSDLFFAG